jgi:hypothetical protein
MRRATFWLALVLLLSMSALSPVAAVSSSAVTVLSDGTGDSVNLRIEPSMDGSIVGQAHPGDVLQLNDAAIVTANGWQWWQIANGAGVAYVRSDLVGAPYSHDPPPVPPVAQAPVNPYPVIDARDLTKAPSRYQDKTFCQMGITFNVLESDGATLIQMYATLPYETSSEWYDYPISVTYPGTLPGLYKDMRIVVYGTGDGRYTFTNSFCGTISQPLIRADTVDSITVARYPAGKSTFPCVPPQ